jgi:hypothetical protein
MIKNNQFDRTLALAKASKCWERMSSVAHVSSRVRTTIQ